VVGYFGPGNQLTDATYALVVNLDYQNGATTTVNGQGNLSLFNATMGTWLPQYSHQATLNLPPGGGMLVALQAQGSITTPKDSSLFPFKYEMNVLPPRTTWVARRDRIGPSAPVSARPAVLRR
jgi:hypothetical protein